MQCKHAVVAHLWLACLVLLTSRALAADRPKASERFELDVLYCGDLESPRARDFQNFLGRYFTRVAVQDLRTFKEEQAKGHDVVVIDWSESFDAGVPNVKKLENIPAPLLSPTFARPVVFIGQTGARVGRSLGLKFGQGCVCLDGPAHHLALDHRLFLSPLKVDPALEEIDARPESADQTIEKLGPKLKTWRVQTKDFPQIDAGYCSTLYGFDDSPDAEVFARGATQKGPDNVALGRHASFFLWGFSAPPADMTPSGQRLLINAICYVREFDGQTPIVRAGSSFAREWALRIAIAVRPSAIEQLNSKFEQSRESLRKAIAGDPRMVPAEYKGNAEAFCAACEASWRKAPQRLLETFPEPLRKEFGADAEKYLAYYRDNLEYLRPAGGENPMTFVVDEEVKSLGLSNRRVELLDRCVSLLEQDDRQELALRLLKRYTTEDFSGATTWRAWLQKNRQNLFFSDVAGYKFLTPEMHMPVPLLPGPPVRN